MILRDISFSLPQENILFDEVLLYLAEQRKGGEALRFWESPELFIVLGRTSKLSDDVYLDKAREHNISVLRRSSGGGTVLQGKGCLNYSLILSKEANPEIIALRKSYQFILRKVVKALAALGVEATFQPISDIASNGKKFSGNAQKRGRGFILHHGTILYHFDLALIEKFLKIPKAVPEYRKGRSHLAFLANISVSREQLKSAFCTVFNIANKKNILTSEERKCLDVFLKTKNIAVDLSETVSSSP